jgi:hypothetical protein
MDRRPTMPENGDDKIPTARVRVLADLVDRTVNNSNAMLNARIDGVERGIEIFQADLVRVPTTVDRAIISLRELIEARLERNSAVSVERFARVESQFIEMNKRGDQLTLANSTAIAAALQAQKEAAYESQKASAAAIAKAETATSESIKQLQALFQTSIGALNLQIQDVKSRLDKGEGGAISRVAAVADNRYEHTNAREETRESRAMVFGIIGVTVGLAALITTIVLAIVPHLSH